MIVRLSTFHDLNVRRLISVARIRAEGWTCTGEAPDIQVHFRYRDVHNVCGWDDSASALE